MFAKTQWIAALIYSAGCLVPSAEAAAPLDDEELSVITTITDAIVRSHPADSRPLFIGLGRSPSLVIADLQLHPDTQAINLPLSSFRHGIVDTGMRFRELTHEEQTVLFRHLDLYLGDTLTHSPRKIVVIDYAANGHSLVAFYQYFNRYLKQRGLEIPTEAFAIVGKARLPQVQSFLQSHRIPFQSHVISDLADDRLFFGSSLQLLAEYGKYEILRHPPHRQRGASLMDYLLAKKQITRYRNRKKTFQNKCLESVIQAVSQLLTPRVPHQAKPKIRR